ncbi:MAG: flagellar type III secretion system pore protein FliP [Planctomycetes bacterium]|nr:flagellar type III secretion system pore protein FliP [Planctomycetota bacterium]
MNKIAKTHLILIMAGLFFLPMLTTTALAAETDPASTNTMPSVPDILRIVDKATADTETQQPNDWNTPVKLVVLFTLLALLPSIVAMTTSFTRIIIVLGFVRRALSTQNIPPNTAILGLAIFLTLYTMAPTFQKINEQVIQPYLNDQIQMEAGIEQSTGILKEFMIRQTRKNDLALFIKMAKVPIPEKVTDLGLHIVTPAFIISEFRTAFEIGCLMFIPFLLLDLVIASVLLSAGMMMLPPVMISLPFKLILFILVDGWGILAQGLSLSFK